MNNMLAVQNILYFIPHNSIKVMENEKPPILGSWNRLYAFVLILHTILIILFYLFTIKYQ